MRDPLWDAYRAGYLAAAMASQQQRGAFTYEQAVAWAEANATTYADARELGGATPRAPAAHTTLTPEHVSALHDAVEETAWWSGSAKYQTARAAVLLLLGPDTRPRCASRRPDADGQCEMPAGHGGWHRARGAGLTGWVSWRDGAGAAAAPPADATTETT